MDREPADSKDVEAFLIRAASVYNELADVLESTNCGQVSDAVNGTLMGAISFTRANNAEMNREKWLRLSASLWDAAKEFLDVYARIPTSVDEKPN